MVNKEAIIKQWLEIVEKEGGLDNYNKYLCDLYPGVFGDQGSLFRRNFQEAAYNWKRRTKVSYLNLLRQHNVIPFSERREAPVATAETDMSKSFLEQEAKETIQGLSSELEELSINNSKKPKKTVWPPPKGDMSKPAPAWSPQPANGKEKVCCFDLSMFSHTLALLRQGPKPTTQVRLRPIDSILTHTNFVNRCYFTTAPLLRQHLRCLVQHVLPAFEALLLLPNRSCRQAVYLTLRPTVLALPGEPSHITCHPNSRRNMLKAQRVPPILSSSTWTCRITT